MERSDYLVPCLLFLLIDSRLILCMCCCVPALVVILRLLFSCSHCVTSCPVFPQALARCTVFLRVCFVPALSLCSFFCCVPDLPFCSLPLSRRVPLCLVFLLSKCSFVRCVPAIFASFIRFVSPLVVFCMIKLFS